MIAMIIKLDDYWSSFLDLWYKNLYPSFTVNSLLQGDVKGDI